jgi:hypothetical protein
MNDDDQLLSYNELAMNGLTCTAVVGGDDNKEEEDEVDEEEPSE